MTESTEQQSNTAKQEPDPEKVIRAELQVPPEIIETYKAGQKEQERLEQEKIKAYKDNQEKQGNFGTKKFELAKKASHIDMVRLVVEFLAVIGLVATLILGYFQREEMVESNENFVKAQRPYIWIHSAEPLTNFTMKSPVTWRVQYVNYGKTPALKFEARMTGFIGKDAMSRADKWFTGHPKRLEQKTGSIVPQGSENNFTPLATEDMLTPENFKYITANDAGIVVIGRFEYEDGFGNQYRSDFCNFLPKIGPSTPDGKFGIPGSAACTTHNEIK